LSVNTPSKLFPIKLRSKEIKLKRKIDNSNDLILYNNDELFIRLRKGILTK